MYLRLFLHFFFLAFSCSLQAQKSCVLEIGKPRCEGLFNPIGVEKERPRFSWHLNSSCLNQSQTAYHILVASSVEKLRENEGDIWDSKKVLEAKCLNLVYKGKKLQSAQTYYWKVKVWNAEGVASNWSKAEQWTMGLMSSDDCKANWVGLNIPFDSATAEQKEAAHYAFATFELEPNKTLVKAVAFVSGLGLFDFYVNGQLISNHRLNPSNTNFFKRALYVGFDVTKNINKQTNALGIVLGNGKHSIQRNGVRKYGLPRVWCQVHLQYSDGSTALVKSDSSWKISTQGPIRFNHEFDGEGYDANLAIKDWASSKMNSSSWQSVEVLKDYKPILTPQLMPPVRVVEIRSAQQITKLDTGHYIVDFGQNVTGWGRLKVRGERGDIVRLRFAELLDSLGQLDTASIRGAKVSDFFILDGEGAAVWEPRFTYHGFRYVEIKGLETVDTATLKACVAHNDLTAVGEFVCSNSLLNQIYANAKWSVRGNYQHVPVDCPQRDERYGWLGDRAATAFGELYLYDIQHFYSKWLQDIADEQLESGALPNLAPGHWEVYRDNVTWPATYVQLVGLLYRYYGDSIAVAHHYKRMEKWMDYMADNYSFEQIIYSDQYGDWLVPPEKITEESNKDARLKSSADILATTTYLLALHEMQEFANLLQKKEAAANYKKRIDILKNALHNQLMDKSQDSYGNHSPTELLLLLADKDLSVANRRLLLDNLLGMLQGQYNGKMAFGLVGMRWPMMALTKNGAVDFAYQLAKSRTYPSWGYMIEQGATTMWEVWTGKAKKSQNHVMLIGDLLQWFYAALGGIQQAEEGIAFDKLKLLPYLPEGLDSVKVSFDSPRGRIVSHWNKTKHQFKWKVHLPVGTTAEVFLPYHKCLPKATSGQFLRFDTLPKNQIYRVFTVGSGTHYFETLLAKNKQTIRYSSPPQISLQDSIIANKAGENYAVELSSLAPPAKIYYTLDGTNPSPKSKLYKGPFPLEKYTMIKAITKEKGKTPSYVKNSFVDIYNSEINGWNYWYYEDRLQQLPNFDTLVAVDSGRVSLIDLKTLKKRKHFWAFEFEAFLDVPADGLYSFYLESDDGARVVIDNQVVVTNDGIHYKTQRKGRIQLTKGKHRIRMEHFNWWSYNGLELLISGPGVPRQRLPISWLYYNK